MIKEEVNIPWFVTGEWREAERKAHEIRQSNAARARVLARRRNIERQRRRQGLVAMAVIAALLAAVVGAIL